jgi:hypothetical protein
LAILLFGMTGIASAAPTGGPLEQIITGLCTDIAVLGNTPFCKNVETQAALQPTSRTVMSAPEMDPASAIAGLTLLLGGIAVIRGRRVKASAK